MLSFAFTMMLATSSRRTSTVAISKNGERGAHNNPFTNSDNTLHAHSHRQPRSGADSSARDSDIGSNALDNYIGNTVHGNNKPKLAPEQNRQHRAPQQTLAEEDFS
jgi:hypothetical protein